MSSHSGSEPVGIPGPSLEHLLDSLPLPVFVAEPDGRVVFFNRGLRLITGMEAESMGERGWLSLVYEEDRAEFESAWRQAVEHGVTLQHEQRIRTADGWYRWFLLRMRCIGAEGEGEAPRFLGTLTDIEDRRMAEESLRVMAHELRAVTATLEQRVAQRTAVAQRQTAQLRALANELTQAEQRERRQLAHMLHDHLQQLLVAARLRLAGCREHASRREYRLAMRRVDDLLEQAIESARTLTVELSPPILNDGGLCAALHWLARWMYEKHGLTVELDVPETVEPVDQDVRAFLFQATRELLFNIVKHAGVKGARVRVERNEHHIEVTIADSGAGFNVSDVQMRVGCGGGFGLFSIRERIEGLGGRLDIRSEPGEGTWMTLRVPHEALVVSEGDEAANVSAAAAWAEDGRRVDGERMGEVTETGDGHGGECGPMIRVLLADDHRMVREGLAGVLRREADIELVAEANDGLQAVELAQALRPDVVIMDITMPRLGGIEATRRLKATCPAISVIGLSMHEEREIAQRMIEAGAGAFLTKGGPSQQLIGAIRDTCRRKADTPRPVQ